MLPLALFLPREDLAPVWDRVAAAVRQRYYARGARHDEMERRLAEAAPVVQRSGDHESFARAVNAMIAGFRDSHFDLYTDADQGFYLMAELVGGKGEMPEVGAWFRRDPDGYTVSMVLEGGEAARAGLRVGDRVTRVDGRPFSPVEALRPAVGRRVPLVYRREGRDAQVGVTVGRSRPLAMFLKATLASRRTVEWKGKRYGYLHLWTQTTPAFRTALTDAVRAARGTDGFILDLRGGFGGTVVGYGKPFAKGAYDGPVAMVIDRGSRSAKEIFAYEMAHARRAVLVGETTAGNVLATYPVRVADWAYLEIPIDDVVLRGTRLEGRGVSPDVPVAPHEDPVARAADVLASPRI